MVKDTSQDPLWTEYYSSETIRMDLRVELYKRYIKTYDSQVITTVETYMHDNLSLDELRQLCTDLTQIYHVRIPSIIVYVRNDCYIDMTDEIYLTEVDLAAFLKMWRRHLQKNDKIWDKELAYTKCIYKMKGEDDAIAWAKAVQELALAQKNISNGKTKKLVKPACICPKCKSDQVIPIMYGYPAPDDMEAARNGEIKLGGCIVTFNQPDRFCKECEYEWCVETLSAEDICKVRFRYWSNWGFVSKDSIVEGQWAFEMFPNGVVRYYSYPLGSRRVLDKEKVQIAPEKIIPFYENLIQIYRSWENVIEVQVCDGCSYELTISYSDGRKKKIQGDMGGGTLDKMIQDFLCTIPEMREKF